jgi:hypothetical protein
MKVLNDIACKLNSIELNSIKKKWDPNWWRRYWNLLVNMVLWKRNCRKTHIYKTQFHGKVVEGNGLKNWSIENTGGSNPFPSVSGVIS